MRLDIVTSSKRERERDAALERDATLEPLSALSNCASAPATAVTTEKQSNDNKASVLQPSPPEIGDPKQVLFVGQVCWIFFA